MADGSKLHSKVTVVGANIDHAKDFLSRPIRQADMDEWAIGSGGKPIWKCIAGMFAEVPTHFFYPRAAVVDDRTVCLWGVSRQHGEEVGWVWLAASEEVERTASMWARGWDEEVRHLHQEAGVPVLVAIVYERNELHVKWLRMLGFERDCDVPLGPITLAAWRHVHYVS